MQKFYFKSVQTFQTVNFIALLVVLFIINPTRIPKNDQYILYLVGVGVLIIFDQLQKLLIKRISYFVVDGSNLSLKYLGVNFFSISILELVAVDEAQGNLLEIRSVAAPNANHSKESIGFLVSTGNKVYKVKGLLKDYAGFCKAILSINPKIALTDLTNQTNSEMFALSEEAYIKKYETYKGLTLFISRHKPSNLVSFIALAIIVSISFSLIVPRLIEFNKEISGPYNYYNFNAK